MRNVDSLIQASWVAPVAPENTILNDTTIVVDDGLVVDVLPTTEVAEKYRSDNTIKLNDHLLIPGLVNAHTHAAMSLFRGLADDMPLMQWLTEHIWPAEQQWVNESFVLDGSRLAVAEMLSGGTTCFNDMYFFADQTAHVAAEAGIRAVVGLIVIDFPTVWATDASEYLDKGIEVHDQFRDHPLIRTAFAPHAPYSVSDEPLERVAVLSEELDIPVHIHVHETEDEILQGLDKYHCRPMERLDRLGLLGPRLAAVHMANLEADEIARAAETSISVVHCPESNMKLASGMCPVQKLLNAGVNMALGTDSAASNNDLDMIGEMRSAALLGKITASDASAVSAEQILHMATLGGAKALGMDDQIGSLEPGKAADIVAIDLGQLNTSPVYHPISQLVYACSRQQIRHVWVAGRQCVKNGELTTLDVPAIRHAASDWQARIGKHA